MNKNIKDISWQRFGRLIAIEPTDKRASSGCVIWRCFCDCGNECYRDSKCLRNGDTKSCGCLSQEALKKGAKLRALKEGEAGFNALFKNCYQRQAKDRDIEFLLTKEKFRELTKQNCFYCGVEPNRIFHKRGSNYVYNGVDRVDTSKGYTLDNCVACCFTCNNKKNNVSIEIMLKALMFLGYDVKQFEKYQYER